MFQIIEPRYPSRIQERTLDTLALLYREGKTLEQIGYFFGVTRERIRQLLKGAVDSSEGGIKVRSVSARQGKTARKRIAKEKRYEAIFGCCYEQVMALNLGHWAHKDRYDHSRASGYYAQKINAGKRGITWKLTFPEWCRIWEESGRWELRGRGKRSYCMTRPGDTGSYVVGNVQIQTVQENSREGHAKAIMPKTKRDELGLTPRERQVYELMNQGFMPREIGAKLGIKNTAVSGMKNNIKARLGNP